MADRRTTVVATSDDIEFWPTRCNLRRLGVLIMAGVVAGLLTKSSIVQADEPNDASKSIKVPPAQAALIGKGDELEKQSRAKSKNAPDRRGKKSPGDSQAVFRSSERTAADKIAAEIRDALQLRKTLVVWLIEQSPDSATLAGNMTDQMVRIMQEIGPESAGNLEMAVVSYGGDVSMLTPEPVTEADKLHSALAPLKAKKGESANSSADDKVVAAVALNQAVEKFLPYRRRGYEVLLVMVGTTTDDQPSAADEAIVALKRTAVPVYGVGPAMPFGLFLPGEKNRRPPPQGTLSGDQRKFESLFPERIQLALSGNQSAADLTDSGFGPFGLERICRLTGGRCVRFRSGAPPGWEIDPATGDVKAELLMKYAPDYVNEEQYQQLLNENKCRMALHNAALLPPMIGLQSVRTDFPKEKDEAALARTIKTAQEAAAVVDQPIQRLYDTLIVGESDRPALTGVRWQAAYDLAMGQTLATKARLDGYNAMLAIIKQGKAFANPDSKRWVLEPADEIAAASPLDKMAKSSRVYLQRVAHEHKGTPWATIAERELKYPAGWKFVEK